MIYAVTADGQRIQAARQVQGYCPCCKAELIAKCGEINIHHWSHKQADCDPWHEPETAWHLGWKALALSATTEVVLGPHRADMVGNGGVVIELQHSSISVEEIREREAFYRNMIWVIDTAPFRRNFCDMQTKVARDGSKVKWFDWLYPHKTLMEAEKPLFFDMGSSGLLEVLRFVRVGKYVDGEWGERFTHRWRCRAKPYSRQAFLGQYLSEVLDLDQRAA